MKILVIGAHPADPIDLAGGTIYNHVQEGDEVIIMSITHGMGHVIDDSFTLQDRVDEFIDAGAMLGVNTANIVGLLDEPYSLINRQHVLNLATAIKDIKPDLVITHHPNEYAHWDHAEVGSLVCRALKVAVKGVGSKWWVPAVYFFAVQFRPEVARLGYIPQAPDILIDVGLSLYSKAVALKCLKSQGHDKIDWYRRFKSFEGEMGRADGVKYSEGFTLYYPLKRKLLEANEGDGFYKAG